MQTYANTHLIWSPFGGINLQCYFPYGAGVCEEAEFASIIAIIASLADWQWRIPGHFIRSAQCPLSPVNSYAVVLRRLRPASTVNSGTEQLKAAGESRSRSADRARPSSGARLFSSSVDAQVMGTRIRFSANKQVRDAKSIHHAIGISCRFHRISSY